MRKHIIADFRELETRGLSVAGVCMSCIVQALARYAAANNRANDRRQPVIRIMSSWPLVISLVSVSAINWDVSRSGFHNVRDLYAKGTARKT